MTRALPETTGVSTNLRRLNITIFGKLFGDCNVPISPTLRYKCDLCYHLPSYSTVKPCYLTLGSISVCLSYHTSEVCIYEML